MTLGIPPFQRSRPDRSGLCGLGGRTDGRQPAQRIPAICPDEFHNFAKVRVAGSNPVVRSHPKPQLCWGFAASIGEVTGEWVAHHARPYLHTASDEPTILPISFMSRSSNEAPHVRAVSCASITSSGAGHAGALVARWGYWRCLSRNGRTIRSTSLARRKVAAWSAPAMRWVSTLKTARRAEGLLGRTRGPRSPHTTSLEPGSWRPRGTCRHHRSWRRTARGSDRCERGSRRWLLGCFQGDSTMLRSRLKCGRHRPLQMLLGFGLRRGGWVLAYRRHVPRLRPVLVEAPPGRRRRPHPWRTPTRAHDRRARR